MKREIFNLTEEISLTPESRVDRQAGIIHNCLFLGVESINNRSYAKAIPGAVSLYDGRPIKANHVPDPKNPNRQSRPVQETIGWTRNPRATSLGIQGNAHILTEKEMGRAFLEAAEKNPKLFRFSHHAESQGYYEKSGKLIVEQIIGVRSVDVVDGDDAATTKSLFESRQEQPRRQIRSLITEARIAPATKKQLLEAVDYSNSWRDDLGRAINKLLASGNQEDFTLAMKIMKLLDPDKATTATAESRLWPGSEPTSPRGQGLTEYLRGGKRPVATATTTLLTEIRDNAPGRTATGRKPGELAQFLRGR